MCMCHRPDQTKNGHQEIKYELPAFYFILRVGKKRFEQEKVKKEVKAEKKQLDISSTGV